MARDICESNSFANPLMQGRYRTILSRSSWLVAVTILCLASGCGKSRGNHPPVIHYTPLPLQAPVQLEVATIDKFVDWVSTMPSSQVPDVKEQIAKVASDAKLVDAVASKLSLKSPVLYGRQLIYLSILGETRNGRAVDVLSGAMLHTKARFLVAVKIDPLIPACEKVFLYIPQRGPTRYDFIVSIAHDRTFEGNFPQIR